MKTIRRGGFQKGERKSVAEYEGEATRIGRCLVHPSKEVARKIWHLRHRPKGPRLPATLEVCHTCDNQWCILDKHHFVGTHADNMQDAASKKRMKGAVGPRDPKIGEKISVTKRKAKLKMPPHVRAALLLANVGRKLSSKQCEELSKRFKGRVSPMKGRKHMKEAKAAIGRAGKGRKPSAETVEKRRIKMMGHPGWFAGKHHTAEARAKISAAAKAQHARQRREAKNA